MNRRHFLKITSAASLQFREKTAKEPLRRR